MTLEFSKVYVSFLAGWLKKQVKVLVDPRQSGNMPKTSIAHYLVSMLGTILKDLNEPECWINLIAINLICHSALKKKLLSKFNVHPFF